jgi:hypothetical protein
MAVKATRHTAKPAPKRSPRVRTGQRPSLRDDWAALQRTLAIFARLMSIAERESRQDSRSQAAAEMEQLAWELVREADPIRISHAEQILGVSNQTVRSWIDEGVLDGFDGSPQRVGVESVVRAKRITDELRENGRDRDFMSAVLSRLEGLALEKDKEFRKSIRQMRRQERRPRPY